MANSCFIFTGSAQERVTEDPCERANKSGVTVDIVECSLKKLAEADAELNETYRRLAQKSGGERRGAKLRAAQRAWIKYRDANCDYETEIGGGGSMATFEYNGCLTGMTADRTTELRQMLDRVGESGEE